MSIFSKNPNEKEFIGGKKHFTDVIKNSGSGELLIWRQPEEDFNTNSTLIVMPGEEAIFINSGVVEQVFENGTYNLDNQNYPFISRLRNAFSGGVSIFNCVVYFVRKAHSAEVLWGTDTPIQVRDPILQIMTSLRARGAYKVQIANPSIFLSKMIGNNVPFTTQDELNKFFINEFQQYIKSSLAKVVMESNQEILGIVAQQAELAAMLKPVINEIINDYGLELITLSIASIDIPEDDPNRQKLEDAYSKKGVMNILGSDWERQQSVDIMHGMANNPAGGAAAAGAGIGMGMAAGGSFANMSGQVFGGGQAQPQNTLGASCRSCGYQNLANAKFCNECGTPMEKKAFCINCGTEMPQNSKFCSECGEKAGGGINEQE